MLPYAVVAITLALVFYTTGVWSEKIQGRLKKWHLVIFWIGFLFDTAGTMLMSEIAGKGFNLNLHGITGLLAIILMLTHAVWATIALIKANQNTLTNFHKFSIAVWLIWLIPFVSGAVFGMAR